MTNATTIARFIATPIISVGILGAAALGMATMANASTDHAPQGPGYSHSPEHANPAPSAIPGWHNHHGRSHINELERRMIG